MPGLYAPRVHTGLDMHAVGAWASITLSPSLRTQAVLSQEVATATEERSMLSRKVEQVFLREHQACLRDSICSLAITPHHRAPPSAVLSHPTIVHYHLQYYHTPPSCTTICSTITPHHRAPPSAVLSHPTITPHHHTPPHAPPSCPTSPPVAPYYHTPPSPPLPSGPCLVIL